VSVGTNALQVIGVVVVLVRGEEIWQTEKSTKKLKRL
jgi:hypothetical protein